MYHLYNNLCIFIFCSDVTLIVWGEEQEREDIRMQYSRNRRRTVRERKGRLNVFPFQLCYPGVGG